ncbi:hypothetical protein E2320_019868, partial [Naja naja]
MGGRYLYHFTPEKGSETGKPVQVIADNLWPCHAQSIERCAKQVIEAASRGYTHEKCEDYIRGQEASQQLMWNNKS